MKAWLKVAAVAITLLVWSSTTTALGAGTTVRAPGVGTPPVVAFDSLPASAAIRPTGNDGNPHQVLARLLIDRDTVKPGEPFRLGLYLEQDENWHTYWHAPGEVGEPTKITWSLPENAKSTPYTYPVPAYFEWESIVSIGYEKDVLLFTTVTLADNTALGELSLGADAGWLACETSCIPGKASLSIPVQVVSADTETTSSAYTPLFDYWESLHPTDPLSIQAFTVETALSASAVHSDESFYAVIQLTPTGDTPLVATTETDTWPVFTPINSSEWMLIDKSVKLTDSGAIRATVEGYTYEPETLPTDQVVGGLFQVPLGDQWVRTEIKIPLPWVAKDVEVTQSSSPLFEGVEGLQAAEGETEAADATAAAPSPAEEPASPHEEASFLQMLLLAFFGGMLLNIMPCVLPVLTLKLYSLVEQTDITQKERRVAGAAYTAGIVLSFLALALAVIGMRSAFGLNVGWGFQFQYPPYVLALGTIVFVFGLSLFGVFEVPAFGANQAVQASNKEGIVGYLLTGAFATLLATPCSAPFLGTGMGFAFSLPSSGILLFFGVAGLGLAFPFLAIAFVPALYKFLPTPGEWMESFKQFMGFTLIATTIWLVDVVGAQTGPEGTTGFLAFLLFVALGCWIFGRWGGLVAPRKHQIIAFLVALVISTAAGFKFLKTELASTAPASDGELTTELDFSEKMPWQAFSEERIDELAGQTVFVDFTADWCLTCKVNERTVLETETVRSAMDRLNVVPLKADWTRRDEVITRWLQRFGKAGVPFYLVIPADRSKPMLPLSEVISPSSVVAKLEEGS